MEFGEPRVEVRGIGPEEGVDGAGAAPEQAPRPVDQSAPQRGEHAEDAAPGLRQGPQRVPRDRIGARIDQSGAEGDPRVQDPAADVRDGPGAAREHGPPGAEGDLSEPAGAGEGDAEEGGEGTLPLEDRIPRRSPDAHGQQGPGPGHLAHGGPGPDDAAPRPDVHGEVDEVPADGRALRRPDVLGDPAEVEPRDRRLQGPHRGLARGGAPDRGGDPRGEARLLDLPVRAQIRGGGGGGLSGELPLGDGAPEAEDHEPQRLPGVEDRVGVLDPAVLDGRLAQHHDVPGTRCPRPLPRGREDPLQVRAAVGLHEDPDHRPQDRQPRAVVAPGDEVEDPAIHLDPRGLQDGHGAVHDADVLEGGRPAEEGEGDVPGADFEAVAVQEAGTERIEEPVRRHHPSDAGGPEEGGGRRGRADGPFPAPRPGHDARAREPATSATRGPAADPSPDGSSRARHGSNGRCIPPGPWPRRG